MPDLMMSGALRHLDFLCVDWHMSMKDVKEVRDAIEHFTELGNRWGSVWPGLVNVFSFGHSFKFTQVCFWSTLV